MSQAQGQEVLQVAYYLGAPATASIVTTMVILYGMQKYGWFKHQTTTNGSSGSKSVDFWKAEMRDIVDKSVRTAIVPILERQTEILDDMKLAIMKLVTLAESRERRRGD